MEWFPPLAGAVLALAFLAPLAWKWQLGVWRVSLFALVVSVVCGVLFGALGLRNP